MISAISVSRTTQDMSRIAGALSGAGLFASLGIGPAYMVIVALYIVATVLTFCVVEPPPLHAADGAPRSSPLRDLKEGVVYVWNSSRCVRGSGSRSSPTSPPIR